MWETKSSSIHSESPREKVFNDLRQAEVTLIESDSICHLKFLPNVSNPFPLHGQRSVNIASPYLRPILDQTFYDLASISPPKLDRSSHLIT